MRSGSISYFSNLIYLLYLRLIGLGVMSFFLLYPYQKGMSQALTPEQIEQMLIEELLLLSSGNDLEAPWDPRPQRIRPPSVGNRGSIRIPSRSPTHRIGRPDLDHSKSKFRTGPSTPTRRKITPLPDDHPQVTNRYYNKVTKQMLYIPKRIDYDHQTDRAIAEHNRLLDVQRRNGRNEFLSKLISEAKLKVKKAKKNAMAAGNYFVNGVHYSQFYEEENFPSARDFLVKSEIPHG